MFWSSLLAEPRVIQEVRQGVCRKIQSKDIKQKKKKLAEISVKSLSWQPSVSIPEYVLRTPEYRGVNCKEQTPIRWTGRGTETQESVLWVRLMYRPSCGRIFPSCREQGN